MAAKIKIIGSLERGLILATLGIIFLSLIFIHVYLLGGDWKAWIQPTPVVPLIGLIVGFLLLHWQLEKQYHNTLEANRIQAQDRLKLEIYKEIAARIESAGPHFSSLIVLPSIFVIELRHRITRVVPGESKYSFESIQETFEKSKNSIITFQSALESYEIAMPGFRIFRERFGSALQDLLVPLSEFNLQAGVLASPKVNVIQWPPSSDDVMKLENLGKKVSSIGHDLQGHAMDLRIAAQNYLLWGIFPDCKVSARQPGDPNVVVTTIPTASD